MCFSHKRQQMMLAHRIKWDIPNQHQFIMIRIFIKNFEVLMGIFFDT